MARDMAPPAGDGQRLVGCRAGRAVCRVAGISADVARPGFPGVCRRTSDALSAGHLERSQQGCVALDARAVRGAGRAVLRPIPVLRLLRRSARPRPSGPGIPGRHGGSLRQGALPAVLDVRCAARTGLRGRNGHAARRVDDAVGTNVRRRFPHRRTPAVGLRRALSGASRRAGRGRGALCG